MPSLVSSKFGGSIVGSAEQQLGLGRGTQLMRLVFAAILLLVVLDHSVMASGPLVPAAVAAAVQDEPVADQAPPAANNAPAKPKKEESLLFWLMKSLGWMYLIIFLGLSFITVALFIMNTLAARKDMVCPPSLIEGFEAHLDEKQYQEAYELAKSDESFLGNVLSSGLAKLSTSYQHAIAAMQEVGLEENMKLEHRLSYLALIGTLSPMIGLFGTVHGMIDSFYGIATGGSSPDPNILAEGISKALLTTLIGLAIAIPAIAGYNILRNRVQRLVLDVGIVSENLMSRFEKVGKKKE